MSLHTRQKFHSSLNICVGQIFRSFSVTRCRYESTDKKSWHNSIYLYYTQNNKGKRATFTIVLTGKPRIRISSIPAGCGRPDMVLVMRKFTHRAVAVSCSEWWVRKLRYMHMVRVADGNIHGGALHGLWVLCSSGGPVRCLHTVRGMMEVARF